ncbi:hypothetical protein BD410DRAFT_759159 [Rickenella mellea]|uniref:Oxidase ustYa n=1 Tax=Rickenella mellea TaxID=50990 RepID=A0A4R5XFR2_9AGAM|nr:hypothetical protein BD410DRAFT_759159 [Rickenella mellea]
MHNRIRQYQQYAVGLVCLASAYLLSTANLATVLCRPDSGILAQTNHSYIDYDYPELYPMRELNNVLMTVEESGHYPLEGPEAIYEWASNAPKGYGYVRLGPNRRTLCVSMFHQLHCLRLIRNALVAPDDPLSSIYHSHHCLNYIRQMALCSPDLTLEPFDPLDRDFDVDKIGATHVCRDWSAVYTEMSRNWDNWETFWNQEA